MLCYLSPKVCQIPILTEIFTHPVTHPGITQYYPYFLLVVGGIMLLVINYDMKTRRRSTHGTARPASRREARKYHAPQPKKWQRPGQKVRRFEPGRAGTQQQHIILGRYRGRDDHSGRSAVSTPAAHRPNRQRQKHPILHSEPATRNRSQITFYCRSEERALSGDSRMACPIDAGLALCSHAADDQCRVQSPGPYQERRGGPGLCRDVGDEYGDQLQRELLGHQ